MSEFEKNSVDASASTLLVLFLEKISTELIELESDLVDVSSYMENAYFMDNTSQAYEWEIIVNRKKSEIVVNKMLASDISNVIKKLNDRN